MPLTRERHDFSRAVKRTNPSSANVPSQGILGRMPKSRNASSSKTSASAAPRVAVAIMAAGKGTRLKSQLPKVLHEVGGKPLLAHVIAAATRVVPPTDVFAIIGHEADRVRAAVAHTGVNFVLQAEQRGTGHALMVAQSALSAYDHVIVLSGDAPQITPQTIAQLLNFHLDEQAAMTLLSADLERPTGYGRIIRKKLAARKSRPSSKKNLPPLRRKTFTRSTLASMSSRCRNYSATSRSFRPPTPTPSITSPTWPSPAPSPPARGCLEDGEPRRSSRR